jgi:hypothetical protein
MPLEPWLAAGLIIVALAAMAMILWLAFRASARSPKGGVLIRLNCPADHEPARIQVGKHPLTGKVSVLWCDRFPRGTITCNRACFTDEIAGSALS